ncbi:alanyl-tRNA synthetase [Natronoarchaeum philippinense]|uniref:Alanyl-tRNA synthetase n=1 Tax=Natronoarchaeum philippinense TaxID=558529 RepID=A0A285NA97_NATPI|nr:alanyl-tRNA editing protein [Natronoarchaeum philippinense]SNZ05823.1 alanyl-tRNA synthetase [Natronoarchaeum philippinense]
MSGQRAAAEPYTTQFSTSVRAVDGCDVYLETTYFYAESGGQPADTGRIGTHGVEHVRLDDGAVVHELAEPDAVRPGQSVLCTIDWERRMYCMRAHTASHALYGAARRLFDEVDYAGFDIGAPEGELGGDETVRIDFLTDAEIDDETLADLERAVNRVVWDAREVAWETTPADEAFERDDVAYNAATEEGIAGGDADAVRLVTIEDWDVAACGGTHVRNTREIGPVTLVDRSNPGAGRTRVEFAVGPAGIGRRRDETVAATAAARRLDVDVETVPEALDRLREERDDLADKAADLRESLVDARIAALPDAERDDAVWRVGTIEGVGPNDAADALRERVQSDDPEASPADAVALVGAERPPFVVVVAAGDAVDAAAEIEDVTDAFGGGGGGDADLAQGGGLDADPGDVVAYLREA